MKGSVFILCSVLLWGCTTDQPESSDEPVSNNTGNTETEITSPPEKKALIPQALFKWEMDSLIGNQRIFVQTFVKQRSMKDLVEIYTDDDWPDEETIMAVYQLSYRPNGSTQFFAERLYGMGDRDVQLTHYFDESNHTVAFEKYVKYYQNGCSEGLAQETAITYFDGQFHEVSSEYLLTDENENPLHGADCIRRGLQDHVIFKTYEDLANDKGTKVLYKGKPS
ncbi:MAG: hypothetical protein KDD36_03155 [Flavobacteriales bacterium]|nr:hypothetical protein [Flavobacteriales bacterium]